MEKLAMWTNCPTQLQDFLSQLSGTRFVPFLCVCTVQETAFTDVVNLYMYMCETNVLSIFVDI